MKQGTLITKIVMFILFAGVALYLAIYAVRSLSDPLTTTMAYRDTLDDSVEATGVLVREEQVLSNGAAIMDVLPEEGQRVAAGETVAILYQNSDALDRKKQLQSLEQEREQLQAALNSGSSLSDAAKLEQQIISSILALRANTAGGDLYTLESDALSLRTQVLQREFVYSSSGDSAAALTAAIADLDAQIAQLKSQSSSETTSVYAPCSGLFSWLADGLESTLTPTSLETMTAAQLKAFTHGTSSPEGTPVGKLITGDRWYFAAVVEPSTARRLQPGDTITVAFSRDFTGEVDMRVERVGDEEADGCVLVLSSARNLKDVTQLRTQTVDLIFERYTGIRVPKQALRMETITSTDSKTGEKVQTQMIGVYTVVGAKAEFKPVDIVREGSDYYLVTPSETARSYIIKEKDGEYYLATPSASQSLPILRAGDEIIVSAPDLYNGKVVLE
ncbi:MAG: HlyD family efflux transporter periplasmic adaptor subunit [Oscillospiraceae bacterium]